MPIVVNQNSIKCVHDAGKCDVLFLTSVISSHIPKLSST